MTAKKKGTKSKSRKLSSVFGFDEEPREERVVIPGAQTGKTAAGKADTVGKTNEQRRNERMPKPKTTPPLHGSRLGRR